MAILLIQKLEDCDQQWGEWHNYGNSLYNQMWTQCQQKKWNENWI